MALYSNGHNEHGGAIYSFAVSNRDATGDVVNSHQGWEIVFGGAPQTVGAEYAIDGRRYNLSKVAGLIYNGRIDHHEYYNRKNLSIAALVIDESFVDSLIGESGCAKRLHFTSPNIPCGEVLMYARSVYDNLRSGLMTAREERRMTECLAFEILDRTGHDQDRIKRKQMAESTSRMLFKDIVVSLHENISNASFDLDELSRNLGITKFHIIRTSKRLGETTPHAYLLRLRMLKAQTLLASSSIPVSEIACRCGFDDLSSFGKAFKRQFGHSPSTGRNLVPSLSMTSDKVDQKFKSHIRFISKLPIETGPHRQS